MDAVLNTVGITCVRDEGPWLLDWIAHHRAHGFSHFLIASHDCLDGSDRLLDALDAAGIITHLPFTPKAGKAVQWQALRLLQDHHVYRDADMAMFFDADEYLVLTEGATLASLLPEGVEAVPLRWHLFGNGGHAEWIDRPVTERFTRSGPNGMPVPLGHLFKSLHRPSAFDGLGVHRPKGDAIWAFASGAKAPAKFNTMAGLIHLLGVPQNEERAWLNHYSVRSIEEFILKSDRGLPNHVRKSVDAGYWAMRNFNTVEDKRIAPMLDASRSARTALAAFDTLHDICVSYHRDRLSRLKKDKEIVDLFWQCELMPTAVPPSGARFMAHIEMLKQAESKNTDG